VKKDEAIRIVAQWDDEAKVWWVSDSNLPGLCTEATTIDELVENLKEVIPALVSEQDESLPEVPFELLTRFGGGDARFNH